LLCYYLCCPMYWLCVLYHCHRVLTQLQLTNIYHTYMWLRH